MNWLERMWSWAAGKSADTTGLLRHVSHGPGQRLRHLTKALPTNREADLILVDDGVTLGRLWNDDEESDFPWNVCLFEPLPAFDQGRAMFEAREAAMVGEHYEEANRIAAEIERRGYKVVRPDAPAMADVSMGLQIAGQWAWFRYRPRPVNA